jgi:hypothetical protein
VQRSPQAATPTKGASSGEAAAVTQMVGVLCRSGTTKACCAGGGQFEFLDCAPLLSQGKDLLTLPCTVVTCHVRSVTVNVSAATESQSGGLGSGRPHP